MAGCASSRFEQRNIDLDDYNTLDVAVMGGDGRPIDKDYCPFDKLFLDYNREVSNLPNKEAKEVYELLRINRNLEMDDNAEELSRSKIKFVIKYLEQLKVEIERDGRNKVDYKRILFGQKYTNEDVLQ